MDYLNAFWVGGLICALVQILLDRTKLMPGRVMVMLVCSGAVLGFLGIYEPFRDFAGAGAGVPLLGFGNTLYQGIRKAVDEDGFLGLFMGGFTASAVGISAALIFSYLHVRKKSEKRYVLWIFLLLSLLPLIFTKLSVFVKELSVFSMLGISYVSFRAVQILVEIYDGHLTKLCPLDVSYFLLFFPSILSGPLDRYQRFSADLQKTGSPEDYEALLREGLWRLATGAIYNFVLGNLIWQYWVSCMPDTLLGTLGYMYGYTLFMFFNFAGYSRMAIGTAYLLGIEQPENFNQPFRSVDMKDFWSRWHISLSTFLRDYVYTRFCMAALRGKWFKERRTCSYLGYVLTMLVMGLWHGLTGAYLIYGAYHGLLMCANDILDTRCKKFKALKKDPRAGWWLRLLTLHLFSFGLLIFSGRLF